MDRCGLPSPAPDSRTAAPTAHPGHPHDPQFHSFSHRDNALDQRRCVPVERPARARAGGRGRRFLTRKKLSRCTCPHVYSLQGKAREVIPCRANPKFPATCTGTVRFRTRAGIRLPSRPEKRVTVRPCNRAMVPAPGANLSLPRPECYCHPGFSETCPHSLV
jgi:hypothetical protein